MNLILTILIVQWIPTGLSEFNLAKYLSDNVPTATAKKKKWNKLITDNTKKSDVNPLVPDEPFLYINESNSPVLLKHLRSAGSVRIECVDQGPGMTADQLSKLFGQGVQFNANELQSGGGSGLGLWISKVNEFRLSVFIVDIYLLNVSVLYNIYIYICVEFSPNA